MEQFKYLEENVHENEIIDEWTNMVVGKNGIAFHLDKGDVFSKSY